jgi:hypothetical protein
MEQQSSGPSASDPQALQALADQVLAASSEQERQRLLAPAVLALGHKLVMLLAGLAQTDARYTEVAAEAGELFGAWLGGMPLADPLDDAERRAVAAIAVLDDPIQHWPTLPAWPDWRSWHCRTGIRSGT